MPPASQPALHGPSGAGDARSPGDRWRAPYASEPARSRGRLLAEPPSPSRTEFQRDRDRILHSAAFRRLQHKTQVFVYHEGDSFRSRLTHTLEVSQVARALARSLGLDEDLAEALALSHDLGHTPFGHVGEDALQACLKEVGGFDHNAQALRIVTRLERRYAAFDGLNLTWETLEGLVKHNGPLLGPDGRSARDDGRPVPGSILDYDRDHPLDLARPASLEAQAAAVADDIAYNAHDIDDGLRAGLLDPDGLRAVPFVDELLHEVDEAHPALAPSRRTHELTRRVITRLVEDVTRESIRRLGEARIDSLDDVRRAPSALIGLSASMGGKVAALKTYLLAHLYRHERLMGVRRDAEAVVRALFARLAEEPGLMPADWREGLEGADEARRLRRVGDYVAGMTDRHALQEHRRLFAATPSLRIS